MIKKRVLCDHCRGSGAASDGDIHSCPECGGSGVRIVKQQIFPGMFAQSQVTCNKCGGRGRIIARECPACAGQKVLEHTTQFTLDVPRGAPEGHEVVFEGEGDESPDWEPGDVVLRVRSRAEKGGLRRKESSLYWKETIGVDEVRRIQKKKRLYITDSLCAFFFFLALLTSLPAGSFSCVLARLYWASRATLLTWTDTSSRWCAKASRSLGSYRLSRARECHFSTVQPLMATCSLNIMSSYRRSSPKRHDKVRPDAVSSTDLIYAHVSYSTSQVSPRRFMGNHIEIKTSYRLINLWLLYTSPLRTGTLWHSE